MTSRCKAIANGKFPTDTLHNAVVAKLYEEALLHDGGAITDNGGLAALSGEKTGRSPNDKRIVEEDGSKDDVWWGEVNRPLSPASFVKVRQQAIDFLDSSERFYVLDAFAGWSSESRIKVRIICSRAYHALFMHNMLIRPTAEELADFGEPDYVIYNAGQQPANESVDGVDSPTCVALSFEQGEMVILGTEYAGEMKKGVFTIMNYLLPKKNVLSMHCSCNEGQRHDVTLFFGLSGTGKTTLSADEDRALIGDDEHGWDEDGVFNIEGGCYAKVVNLSEEKEPQIYRAIKFGSVLENTVQHPRTREIQFENTSITQNTRCAYPIEFIDNARIPCRTDHPRNIIFLTCDAFGVLPPVSKLTAEQAMYHFISGYTAKVAGTEMGVTEPEATFSACFGAAFLVWHPVKYAELLADQMRRHGSSAWLVNTGWTGGAFGVGTRINLSYTRAIINAIHGGSLLLADYTTDLNFGLSVPKACNGVPGRIMQPWATWDDGNAFQQMAKSLAGKFRANFEKFASIAGEKIIDAGPRI